MRWYCAHTEPRRELWAHTNLWSLGFETYLPQYLRRRSHAGKIDRVARPLFPRYLFVRCASKGDFAKIRSARGVNDIVRMGDESTPVADTIVADIRKRESVDGLVHLPEVSFKRGEQVRVLHGSLGDHVGLFNSDRDERRVFILLTLLGRDCRVEVDRLAVGRPHS